MCKRFIEDLANKIIEKIDLNTFETKKLLATIQECKNILYEREEELISKLEMVYHLEDYEIRRCYGNSANIKSSSGREFSFGYQFKCYIFYYSYPDKHRREKFSTKEELLNRLIIETQIKDSKKLYEICLEKINIIEELETNY